MMLTAFLVVLGATTLVSGIPQSLVSTPFPPLPALHKLTASPNPMFEDVPSTTQATPKLPRPEMYSLRVESRIESRYAKTVISSRLANPANKSQEIFFSVILPETAFISGFLIEVDGKVYEAYVREKEEAKHEYEQAVASGLTAAHVALSARDSNRFTVSVNVEPTQKVTFNLTYEELLSRKLSRYSHVLNLDPGQVVRDLQVDVYITENRNITQLHVPELRSGNEINPNQEKKENGLAVIERPSPTEVHVRFSPTAEQQLELAKKGKDEENLSAAGLSGQFVVQYDVERDPQAGEVLVSEGYFVHFFAPTDLQPLRKHAIFVLDVSGSMSGRKIEQLKEAMESILDDLNPGDYFNIVEFSYSVTVWNLDSTSASAVFAPYNAYDDSPKPHPGPTPAFPATPEYRNKAKEIVRKMHAGGGTNIHDALKTALRVAHEGAENITTEDKPEPIIVFLTDGEATVGEVRPNKIQSAVRELNMAPSASIFSLSLGSDADFSFLKKLSLRNSGFARKIYEAADTALQLRDFYRQVASPLLANVTFNYPPGQIEESGITRKEFPTFFSGSELVVAGKLTRGHPIDLTGEVMGSSLNGASTFSAQGRKAPSSLERLWAYLTIQQLLEEYEATQGAEDETAPPLPTAVASSNDTGSGDKLVSPPSETMTPKEKALKLALAYSFVTPLTSLVVVKPNDTHAVGSEVIQPDVTDGDHHFALPLASAPFAPSSGGQAVPVNFGNLYLTSKTHTGGSVDRVGSSGLLFGGFAAGAPPPLGLGGFPAMAARPHQPFNSYATTRAPYPPMYPAPVDTFQLDDEEFVTAPAATTDLPEDELLSSVDQLQWLTLAANGTSSILLPVGENGTLKELKLAFNEGLSTDDESATCRSGILKEKGVCVPLSRCPLRVISKDMKGYIQHYFCERGDSIAGVCCPERIYGVKITTESNAATTVVTDVPSS